MPYRYDLTASGIKHVIDAPQVWEYFVGNQTETEFMQVSTGHAAPYADDEIDLAVQKYVEDCRIDNPGSIAAGDVDDIVHALKVDIRAFFS
jgi:hypothetical protein